MAEGFPGEFDGFVGLCMTSVAKLTGGIIVSKTPICDCFSYALARDKREPILFKGDDFVHTDLRPAVEEQ